MESDDDFADFAQPRTPTDLPQHSLHNDQLTHQPQTPQDLPHNQQPTPLHHQPQPPQADVRRADAKLSTEETIDTSAAISTAQEPPLDRALATSATLDASEVSPLDGTSEASPADGNSEEWDPDDAAAVADDSARNLSEDSFAVSDGSFADTPPPEAAAEPDDLGAGDVSAFASDIGAVDGAGDVAASDVADLGAGDMAASDLGAGAVTASDAAPVATFSLGDDDDALSSDEDATAVADSAPVATFSVGGDDDGEIVTGEQEDGGASAGDGFGDFDAPAAPAAVRADDLGDDFGDFGDADANDDGDDFGDFGDFGGVGDGSGFDADDDGFSSFASPPPAVAPTPPPISESPVPSEGPLLPAAAFEGSADELRDASARLLRDVLRIGDASVEVTALHKQIESAFSKIGESLPFELSLWEASDDPTAFEWSSSALEASLYAALGSQPPAGDGATRESATSRDSMGAVGVPLAAQMLTPISASSVVESPATTPAMPPSSASASMPQAPDDGFGDFVTPAAPLAASLGSELPVAAAPAAAASTSADAFGVGAGTAAPGPPGGGDILDLSIFSGPASVEPAKATSGSPVNPMDDMLASLDALVPGAAPSSKAGIEEWVRDLPDLSYMLSSTLVLSG